MRLEKYRFVYGVIFLLSLYGCSSGKVARTPTTEEEVKPLPKIVIPTDPVELKLYEQAKVFDRFLKKELKTAEIATLRTECEKAPKENLFCYGVTNFEELEEKRRVNAARLIG